MKRRNRLIYKIKASRAYLRRCLKAAQPWSFNRSGKTSSMIILQARAFMKRKALKAYLRQL